MVMTDHCFLYLPFQQGNLCRDRSAVRTPDQDPVPISHHLLCSVMSIVTMNGYDREHENNERVFSGLHIVARLDKVSACPLPPELHILTHIY